MQKPDYLLRTALCVRDLPHVKRSSEVSLNTAFMFMSSCKMGLGVTAESRSGMMGKRTRLESEKRFWHLELVSPVENP